MSIPIPPDFMIVVQEAPMQISASLEKEVDRIWKKEQERLGHVLYNGKVLVYVDFKGNRLTSRFVEYKYYLAQSRNQELPLNICTVGMSGITKADGKVLVGRRADWVAHYPNWYELAPSGGIDPSAMSGDRINPESQALLELVEETRIQEADVLSAKPLCLVRDSQVKTIEVCVEILVKAHLGHQEIEGTEEYPELRWISYKDLGPFFAARQTVSTSLILAANEIH